MTVNEYIKTQIPSYEDYYIQQQIEYYQFHALESAAESGYGYTPEKAKAEYDEAIEMCNLFIAEQERRKACVK